MNFDLTIDSSPPAPVKKNAMKKAESFIDWIALDHELVETDIQDLHRLLLQNENRDRIYSIIEDHPGIHQAKLMKWTGLAKGALVHHLDKMERAEMINRDREANRVIYRLASFRDESE